MKRKIITITFILIAIITMIFSGKVIATEEEIITQLDEFDLSSISVIRGTTPKYFNYENDKYVVEQEWYYSNTDNPTMDINRDILKDSNGNPIKVKQFENDFDTMYVCQLVVTPKIGYKFDNGVNGLYFSGLNFECGIPAKDNGMIDGKFVLNIFCKALEEYELTINADSKIDAKITMNGNEITPGEKIKVYSLKSYNFHVEAKENYRINNIEYVTNGQIIPALVISLKSHDFVISPKDDVEVKITTEKVIESVEVTGFKPPLIGDTKCDLELKVPESANYQIVDYYWYDINENRKKEDDEKFENHKQYSLYVILRSTTRFLYNDSFSYNESDKCKATIDGQMAKILNVTKEDTNYYLVMSSYDFYPNMREYSFIDNTADQIYTRGKDKTLTFKIDADYSLFKSDAKIFIDQEELSEEYYTHKEGSIIITLTEEYMDKLELNEHFFDVFFGDYGYAITTFTIVENKDDATLDDDKNDNNPIVPGQNDNNGKDENLEVPENDKNSGDIITPEENKDNEKPTISENDKINEDLKDNTQVPQTGDNVLIYFMICIISILVVSVLSIKKIRK